MKEIELASARPDLRLHAFEWAGPAGAPTVVLSHANSLCAAVWAPIARRLQRRWRVVAFDLRGHGGSGKPAPDGDAQHPHPYRWSEFGEDVFAVIEQVGRPAVVVCHSFSGSAALLAAPAHPDAMSALVLIDPVLQKKNPEGAQKMAEGTRKARQEWDDAAACRAWFAQNLPKVVQSTPTDECLDLLVRWGTEPRDGTRVALRCARDVEAAVYAERVGGDDVVAAAGRCRTPILELLAERRRGTENVADAAAFAQGIVDGDPAQRRSETVADTGHFMPLEKPDDVADRILRFVP